MVALAEIRASNAQASTAFPPGLVGVFAGTTSGIGELALKAFARHAPQPRIYFIGRSDEAGARLTRELKTLNPQGQYVFIQADLSLLKTTDEVCRDIKAREKVVNVLFMSQGTLRTTETTEGLPYVVAVSYYSRLRMATNLLPLIQAAPHLRRVISTFTGGKEGFIYVDDIVGRKVPFSGARGHLSGVMTLGLEALAKRVPEVTFIHNFPGSVKTNLIRKDDGLVLQVARLVFKLMPGRMYMDNDECGERHAYLCLGGRYPPANGADRVEEGVKAVKGTDGKVGSGVYSLLESGEASPDSVLELLGKYRREGVLDKVWDHTEEEFKRITGTVSI